MILGNRSANNLSSLSLEERNYLTKIRAQLLLSYKRARDNDSRRVRRWLEKYLGCKEVALIELDINWKVIAINGYGKELFGVNKGQYLNRKLFKLRFIPRNEIEFLELLSKMTRIRKSSVAYHDNIIIDDDGQERPFIWFCDPKTDETFSIKRITLIGVDANRKTSSICSTGKTQHKYYQALNCQLGSAEQGLHRSILCG